MITGAGAGLGRACAQLYADHGASVMVTDVDPVRADETVSLIRASGGQAEAATVDVQVEDDVRRAIGTTIDAFGKLDVLHNNAGVPVPGFGKTPFEELTADAWHRVIDVNLTGVFFGCKHAVRPMRANGGGSIIITSSAAALVGFRGHAVYGAAKGGAVALARGLAVDLGADNIRVNVICPMYGMSANFAMPSDAAVVGRSYEEVAGDWDPSRRRIPLKVPRPPGLADTAYVALFLASDESAYMSGVAIPTADGGSLSHVSL